MAINQQTADVLEAVSKILLRCFLFGLVLLLIWTTCVALAPDLIFRVHGNLFDLTLHELNVVHYSAIVFVKICNLLFFGFPYLAIRLVLRNRMT